MKVKVTYNETIVIQKEVELNIKIKDVLEFLDISRKEFNECREEHINEYLDSNLKDLLENVNEKDIDEISQDSEQIEYLEFFEEE